MKKIVRARTMKPLLAATFVLMMSIAIHLRAEAQSMTEKTAPAKPSIVLVHGAWADGSSWSEVIPRLQKKGYEVLAAQLPRSSLADDVAATARTLARVKGPTILVGHSWGGVVITEAGNAEQVAGLVYVSSVQPEAGESLGDLLHLEQFAPPSGAKSLQPDATGYFWLDPAGLKDAFAADLPADKVALLTATQGPLAGKTLGDKITTPAWKSKPSWSIIPQQDHSISPELQAWTAKRAKITPVTIDSSHVVMLAHPDDVVRLIETAAQGIASKKAPE